jgi:hypothetical protein
MDTPPIITPAELRAIIQFTGLTQAQFAVLVMGCDPRTLRRWLAGSPLRQETANWLRSLAGIDVSPTHLTITVTRP